MRKIVVTGCAGMIGSHLVDELVKFENVTVVGVDNLSFGRVDNMEEAFSSDRFTFYRVDVLDLEALKIICCGADTIVHLAALKKSGEADASLHTLRVNSRGTENVFDVARMWRCKVVLASTSDVYGMAPVPHTEDSDLVLGPTMIKRWAYAVSKLYDEQLAFAYFKDEGVPIVILRYFGGFSPRSNFSWSGGHIPIFIDAILRNEPVKIHGDGTQTRSMADVRDLIRGTITAIGREQAVGHIINLGNDEEMSVLDSARMIAEVVNEETGLHREMKIIYVPFAEIFGQYKDIMRRLPELTKARRLLDYEPRYRLREAVKNTVRIKFQQLKTQGAI
ncbi:MAG: NAD-dependent epimerase/dehydratase family protein [Thermodesulfobacteriota bacterium]